jgi:hypothetical protein
MSMRIQDLFENQAVNSLNALRNKALARSDPAVIQAVIKELKAFDGWAQLHWSEKGMPSRVIGDVESHLRDVLEKIQIKRIEQVEKETGLDDISQIITNHAWGDPMFWIKADGTIGHVPLAGHHEDEAFQYFGGGKKRVGNWIRVAQNHGWVRGVLRKNGELNLEYLKGKMSPKAKNSLIKLLMAMKDEISRVVFEWPVGKSSQNQVVNDIRSALVLIRQG